MNIVYDGTMDPRALKDVIGQTIRQLAAEDPDVIYLDADLMSCVGTCKWSAENPTRGFNCGVSEANMIGVACGLAATGFKPIVHTFGPFASRRVFDQVFLSAGYAKNDITVIGTDPGVCASFNGGTHMPFEDIALYRTIPTATIIDITDANMLISVLRQCKDHPGVKYIRVGRKQNAKVFADGEQTPIGPGIPLREGRDLVIFASGIMVHEAMLAANRLEQQGISAAVVNIFTIKPLDTETVTRYAESTGNVIVAENHNRIGGLYSAVCECLAIKNCAKIDVVAVNDEFGEVGPQDYLQKRFGLTAEHIEACAKRLLSKE
ncbi:MAG TPA: transketolase C-terminal domain-containing protein [Feifaniaceae bacterium]|nr:transketolase C-terminal domain-containing protein [Feifaniaceae bacterium]